MNSVVELLHAGKVHMRGPVRWVDYGEWMDVDGQHERWIDNRGQQAITPCCAYLFRYIDRPAGLEAVFHLIHRQL